MTPSDEGVPESKAAECPPQDVAADTLAAAPLAPSPALPLSTELVGEKPPSTQPDALAKQEKSWFFGLRWPDRARVDLIDRIVDIALRFGMSGLFLWMAWWWLGLVGGIIRDQTTSEKHLSDTVLVSLLTSTTINVLGLLYFIANYLFPKQKAEKDISTPTTPSAPKTST